MTKTLTRAEAAQFLLRQDRLCLLTHRRPDGDTLGSAAVLCLGLRSLGKTCHVLINSQTTPRFRWLCQDLTVDQIPEGALVVSVDVASPSMLPDDLQQPVHVTLRIDHHSAATSFTDLETVDGESASCGELVWDILEEMGVEMTQPMADALYTAISTDTGCFRFSNTTAHTFAVAAKCAAAGARVYQLNQELFETVSLQRLRMQGWMVENMRLYRQGAVALCAIPYQVEQSIGVTEDDMDNISNFPRTVSGVKMAATLRENSRGQLKLSVRAVPGWDATAITTRFGGGGHKGAAGASLSCPMEEAVKLVEEAMLEGDR